MQKLNILGIMSGSSMDGVDLALCQIGQEGEKIEYKVLQSAKYDYDDKWRLRLSKLRTQNAITYVKTDVFYAHYLAELVNDFKKNCTFPIDMIASHGHTIFHNPEIKLTSQIGDGSTLSALTELPVVSDFRRTDLALHGEGAPLVAIGDEMLFSEYDFCLNLGGFANISCKKEGVRVAFDIAACNILTNRLARDINQDYDTDGLIAEKGTINKEMLEELNGLEFFSQSGPKSLNRDWISEELWPIVKNYRELSLEDRMKTIVEHVAYQIGKSIEQLANGNSDGKKLLITGGGAFNKTLIEHIGSHTEAQVILPENELINNKESIIFAFLGYLRVNNLNNTLASATGAAKDSIGGVLSGDFSKCI